MTAYASALSFGPRGRVVDRIDAMKVFVAALNEGSLAGAGRKLGKSPAAVSRAIAFLEAHVGTELLHRTTRSIKLSEDGERYAVACRRILTDLEEADMAAAGERSAPRGMLTITAPVAAGEKLLRPVLDAFMDKFPAVSVRLDMLDRTTNLIDEGFDVALRIAHLADSTLVALRVGDLPRFVVNGIRAAVASAVQARGVVRMFSYHLSDAVADGTLKIILADDEHAPLPVHLVSPHGRLSVPKVRAFVDFALPKLREGFEDRALVCSSPGETARTR